MRPPLLQTSRATPTQKTGVWAFLKSESTLGISPKILIAPGYTHQCTLTPGSEVANVVVAQLVAISAGSGGVGDRLRAIVIADGPNTTQADAQAYADLHVSDRLYVVDPWVKVNSTTVLPASAFVAGVIAKSDAERGFWYSQQPHHSGHRRHIARCWIFPGR